MKAWLDDDVARSTISCLFPKVEQYYLASNSAGANDSMYDSEKLVFWDSNNSEFLLL